MLYSKTKSYNYLIFTLNHHKYLPIYRLVVKVKNDN